MPAERHRRRALTLSLCGGAPSPGVDHESRIYDDGRSARRHVEAPPIARTSPLTDPRRLENLDASLARCVE